MGKSRWLLQKSKPPAFITLHLLHLLLVDFHRYTQRSQSVNFKESKWRSGAMIVSNEIWPPTEDTQKQNSVDCQIGPIIQQIMISHCLNNNYMFMYSLYSVKCMYYEIFSRNTLLEVATSPLQHCQNKHQLSSTSLEDRTSSTCLPKFGSTRKWFLPQNKIYINFLGFEAALASSQRVAPPSLSSLYGNTILA